MLIPLTHEKAWVRRIPWVSYGIVALCILALAWTSNSAGRRASDERMSSAVYYWLAHPQLDPDPRLLTEGMRRQLEEHGLVRQPGEVDEAASAAAQEELDALTTSWLEGLDDDPLWRFGVVPSRPSNGVSWLTSMFLHAGFWHLIGNVFFLYLVGPVVEDTWGKRLFVAFYLLAGLIAAAGFAAQYPGLFRPLVGASGAIAGLLGAFLVLHGRTKIRLLLWIVVPLATFSAPAWLMLPMWLASEVLSALAMDRAAPDGAGGVAYWAHVWGFVGGAAMAFGLERLGLRPGEPEAYENPLLQRAHEALERGRTAEAWRLLTEECRERPENVDAAATLWQIACDEGRPMDAATALLRAIRHQARAGEPVAAVESWFEFRGTLPDRHVDPRLEVALAAELQSRDEWPDAQADLLRAALEHLRPQTPVQTVIRIGQLAARLPYAPALEILDRASAQADLPPRAADELALLRAAL